VTNIEFIHVVLKWLRKGKKQREIAELTGRHYNTIYKYVKYIRTNLVRSPEETVNKIDSRLDEELEQMTHHDLIAWRRAITPQKIEAQTEFKGEMKKEYTFNFNELPEDEREFCRRIARKYIKANNKERSASIH